MQAQVCLNIFLQHRRNSDGPFMGNGITVKPLEASVWVVMSPPRKRTDREGAVTVPDLLSTPSTAMVTHSQKSPGTHCSQGNSACLVSNTSPEHPPSCP